MNTVQRWLLVCAALSALTIQAHAMGVEPLTAPPGVPEPGDPDGCANSSPCGTSPGAECLPCGVGANPFGAFGGDSHRNIRDLEVWGGVGELPLTWERYGHSRNTYPTLYFGQGHQWRHSYQWELVNSSATGKQVNYPDGTIYKFTYTNGVYVGVASCPDMLMSNVDGSFTLQRANAWRYKFTSYTSNGNLRLDTITDRQSNVYTLAYASGTARLTQITEPGGRWLKVSYTNLPVAVQTWTTLATIATTPPSNQWTTLSVTDTNQYRYLRYTSGNWSEISEIEFQDTNSVVLTGTAFGSSPAISNYPSATFEKATDGDTNTFFYNAYQSFGLTGIDLGAGNAQRVSKVRFYPPPLYPGRAVNGLFQGAKLTTNTVTVISRVDAFDSRSVVYHYTNVTDFVLEADYLILTGATYSDGTQAEYGYVSQWPGQRVLLAEAIDPRVIGNTPHMKYVYSLRALQIGVLSQEQNGDTGAMIATLESLGSGNNAKVTYANGKIETFRDNGNAMLTNRTDGLGRVTASAYSAGNQGFLTQRTDALGRVTTFSNDAQGRLLSQTNPDSTTESWTYDSLGRALTHTDELGHTTTYTRDPRGRMTRIDDPDSSYETFTYNSFSEVTSHRLRNGGTESATYDTRGLKTTSTDALGNVATYSYNPNDLVAAMTDANGNTTSYQYDERGQVTQITNADASYRTMAYDAYGNRTNVVDELGHGTSMAYDEFKRKTSMTDALGRTTFYSYDLPGAGGGVCGCALSGNHPTAIMDPKGNVTEFGYDLEWQLTCTVDPDGRTTSYAYDAAGNRVAQTDANGHTYRWAYDSRNRDIVETNAAGPATTYAYDLHGNRTSRVNGAGEVTFWNYDTLNRITVNGSGPLQYEYDYDAGGRRTAMRTRVSGSVTEATSYTWDLDDRLQTKVDPSGYTLSYGYDAVGNRTSLTVGSVLNQSYTYDNRNRVSTITGNGKTTTYTYDSAGRRTGSVWPNSSTATYTYDNANELLSLNHKTSGGADIATFAYGYDLSGNRTNMTTLEGANSYGYDSNNWLVAVSYPDSRTQAFTYDAVGNRVRLDDSGIGVSPVLSSYDAANQQVTDIAGTTTNSYTFDGAGRLVSQTLNTQPRSYAYDFRSQMTGLTDTNSATGVYAFDGNGSRIVEAAVSGGTFRYVYDGPNVVLELTNGVVQAVYVNNLSIDQSIERIQFVVGVSGGRHVYHTDGLDSVWAMTDDLQLVAKSYSYEAFGKIRAETGTGLLFPNRYTYTARELLGDSLGLMYYRARVMDPNLGKFTSEDLLWQLDGENLFRYVLDNPIRWFDPTGMSPWSDCYDNCVATLNPGGRGTAIVQGCSALSRVAPVSPVFAIPAIWRGGTTVGCAIGCGIWH